jgi:hypothetical protein
MQAQQEMMMKTVGPSINNLMSNKKSDSSDAPDKSEVLAACCDPSENSKAIGSLSTNFDKLCSQVSKDDNGGDPLEKLALTMMQAKGLPVDGSQ